MSQPLAVKTENLGRIYKIRNNRKEKQRELVALENVNLEIREGELFGLLGPNGAGKTTLIKILTTLLSPTSGRAWVAGLDVTQQPGEVRKRINMVSGGETSGYGLLTVRENLWMFAQFYGIPSAEANRRIKTLAEILGITDRLNTKSSDLSTGLRQKMNIIRGFLTDPEVLFLDEPTLGLDVGASRDVRSFIRRWMDENPHRTLLLTTTTWWKRKNSATVWPSSIRVGYWPAIRPPGSNKTCGTKFSFKCGWPLPNCWMNTPSFR